MPSGKGTLNPNRKRYTAFSNLPSPEYTEYIYGKGRVTHGVPVSTIRYSTYSFNP